MGKAFLSLGAKWKIGAIEAPITTKNETMAGRKRTIMGQVSGRKGAISHMQRADPFLAVSLICLFCLWNCNRKANLSHSGNISA